jgi:hypothetical protein
MVPMDLVGPMPNGDKRGRRLRSKPLIALYLQDFMLELLATLLNGGLQVLSIAQAADSVRVSRSTH